MRKFQIEGREIHLPGNNLYVAVCWNCREGTKMLAENDLTYEAKVLVRDGSPYIDFVSIRGKQGDYWIDKDSAVEGGISLGFARKIQKELRVACDYLGTLQS